MPALRRTTAPFASTASSSWERQRTSPNNPLKSARILLSPTLTSPMSAEHRLPSTDRRNSLAKHLGWFHPTQGLSRAIVQLPRHRAQVSGRVLAEVICAREVLAEQTVRVLAAATLPGAVGIAEVDLHVRIHAEPQVVGHFLALVPGQRPTQLGRQLGHLAGQRYAHLLGRAPVR